MKRKLNLIRLNHEQVVDNEDMGRAYAGASTSFCWGDGCACGCVYEGQPGGSTTQMNASYNHVGDVDGKPLQSPGFTWANSNHCVWDFADLQ
jgi:hypothetical protein